MAYAIIDPFIANSPSQVLEVFHTEAMAKEFLQRRIEEDESGWCGCMVEEFDDEQNFQTLWVRYSVELEPKQKVKRLDVDIQLK